MTRAEQNVKIVIVAPRSRFLFRSTEKKYILAYLIVPNGIIPLYDSRVFLEHWDGGKRELMKGEKKKKCDSIKFFLVVIVSREND